MGKKMTEAQLGLLVVAVFTKWRVPSRMEKWKLARLLFAF